MSSVSAMNKIMERGGATIHTGFPAKVLTCNGSTAKLQPLFNYNGQAATPLDGVPVPKSVRKFSVVEEVAGGTITHWTKASPPEPGDVVYCLCAEQTLGASYKGTPTGRVGNLHHQLSDAVVVAIF